MTDSYIDADFRAEDAGGALAVRESGEVAVPAFFGAMRPADKIAYATEVADALKPILIAKKLVHKLNAKNPDDEYVELEGWQTCGNLCGVTAKIEWSRPLPDGSGFEARAVVVLVNSGVEIGAGEAVCTKSEKRWSYAEPYAIKGMAQTRAQSRALRGVLAWILVLAGYKPTPSEEMPPLDEQRRDPQKPAGTTEPPEADQEPTPSLKSLQGIANAAGVGRLGPWLIASGIAPDLLERERAVLNRDEALRAKAALEAIAATLSASQEVPLGEQERDRGGAAAPKEGGEPGRPPAEPMSERQRGQMFALFGELNVSDARRRDIYRNVAGVEHTADLTRAGAHAVIEHLLAEKEGQA